MTVQHYVKKDFHPGIEEKTRLLYLSSADENQAHYPSLLHKHTDCLEIVYVYQGEAIHRIGNKIYHTKAGNLSVFNCNVLHDEMTSPNKKMGFFNCAITGLKMEGLPDNCLISEDTCPVLDCGAVRWCVESIFRQIQFHLAQNRNGAENICEYLMKALLTTIINQIPFIKENKNTKDNKIIIEVTEYIDEHYCEKLTFDSICEKLHISESFLSHRFKDVTGFSPIQYITRRRMGKAQSLLNSTDRSVTDIGAQVGYDNNSYFNMTFKKIVGMTPLEYRRYWIGKEQYRKLNKLNESRKQCYLPPQQRTEL